MFKSIVSVLAGYLATAVLIVITTMLAGSVMLDASNVPTTPYLIVNLILGIGSAMAGGYVTAMIAPQNPKMHTYYLAGLIIIIGLLSMSEPLDGQPSWYPWVVMLIGVVGVITGGWLQQRKSNAPISPAKLGE